RQARSQCAGSLFAFGAAKSGKLAKNEMIIAVHRFLNRILHSFRAASIRSSPRAPRCGSDHASYTFQTECPRSQISYHTSAVQKPDFEHRIYSRHEPRE